MFLRQLSNFHQRLLVGSVATGLIALIITYSQSSYGMIVFSASLSLICVGAQWEFYQLAQAKQQLK